MVQNIGHASRAQYHVSVHASARRVNAARVVELLQRGEQFAACAGKHSRLLFPFGYALHVVQAKHTICT